MNVYPEYVCGYEPNTIDGSVRATRTHTRSITQCTDLYVYIYICPYVASLRRCVHSRLCKYFKCVRLVYSSLNKMQTVRARYRHMCICGRMNMLALRLAPKFCAADSIGYATRPTNMYRWNTHWNLYAVVVH